MNSMNGSTSETHQLQCGCRFGRILRSIGAVLAGLLAIFILSIGTDAALHASGVYPPWFEPMAASLWLLAIAHRIVYGVVGAYITARLAPSAPARPMKHAMVLGAIGVVLSIIGVASTWNQGPEFGPKWFNLGLIAISLPCSWIGGRLREMQLHVTSRPQR